jgi:hypothetical protein
MHTEKPSPESQATLEKSEESKPKEIGGFAAEGLKEPTRFGDWEVRGRCSDF